MNQKPNKKDLTFYSLTFQWQIKTIWSEHFVVATKHQLLSLLVAIMKSLQTALKFSSKFYQNSSDRKWSWTKTILTPTQKSSAKSKFFFRTFHLSSFGSDLASKLRQKWIDYSIAKHGQIKHKRSVQNQIKFLEKLHDKLNKIIVSYQNANSKLGKYPCPASSRSPRTTIAIVHVLRIHRLKICLGPAWFLNCPWNHEHFQSWFARLWNHKLKPFLQANIIEGIKLYGDKGNEWDDIITFIKNR